MTHASRLLGIIALCALTLSLMAPAGAQMYSTPDGYVIDGQRYYYRVPQQQQRPRPQKPQYDYGTLSVCDRRCIAKGLEPDCWEERFCRAGIWR